MWITEGHKTKETNAAVPILGIFPGNGPVTEFTRTPFLYTSRKNKI